MSSPRKIVTTIIVVIVLILASFTIWHFVSKPAPVVVLPVADKIVPIHKVIGLSVEGRKIDSYTYGNGKTSIVFVGGIHGGYEWNSVYLAYRFMDYIEATPKFIPENLAVTVIPSANPDGVFKVVGKEGRFTVADVPANIASTTVGRFNAHKVDLNRNFDCKWQSGATWQGKAVSAGTSAFSEPEAAALRDFALANRPAAFIFWHSQANAVYASQCVNGILPETLDIMNAYARVSGYPAVKSFDSYVVTGAVEDWLASIKIPAITVELKTHEMIEWDKNLAGISAVLDYYSKK